MIDVTALLAAIDADPELAALAAIGDDQQIAERLAAETVKTVRDPTYVKEGNLRKAILAYELAQDVPAGQAAVTLAAALSTAATTVGAIKNALTTGEAAAATSLFWGYAEIGTPVDGLNVGGDFERAFLDSLVATSVVSLDHAAAIKALAETNAPKWPGISADVVSDALKERRPNGKVVTP